MLRCDYISAGYRQTCGKMFHSLRFKISHAQVCLNAAFNSTRAYPLAVNHIKWESRNLIFNKHRKNVVSGITRLFSYSPQNEEKVSIEYPEDTGEDASTVLSNLSETDRRKLLSLQLEYDAWHALGSKVPDHMTDELWLHMFKNYPTVSSRRSYYSYLFKNEKKSESNKRKKAIRYQEHLERIEKTQQMIAEGVMDPVKNTFLLKVYESTMKHWYNNNVYYSMVNGPNVILDFDYEHEMSLKNISKLGLQIRESHHTNRTHRDPVHLHFCNLHKTSITYEKLHRYFAFNDETTVEVSLPYTFTEKDYLDLYPREKLVYLSPNSPYILDKFCDEDVYIIGALVDQHSTKPLSFTKAKKQGIRTARLPIDQYLQWQQGTKSLTLNQVLGILLDARRTRDWNIAFKHVPSRKIKS